MRPHMRATAKSGPPRPSLLFVTTVAGTHGFLLPFARHFRGLGWRVDGCASGISGYRPGQGCYDEIHELSLSRSIRDLGAIAGSAARLQAIIANGYDIVHVHTPIAAFLARAVIRRMPRQRRPKVVYTAHGFHFHEGGNPIANRAFVIAEQVAGRWTDRLVVINAEDLEAARRYRIVPTRRLIYMPGIGVDTHWYSSDSVSPDDVRQALDRVGLSADAPYFVTVGEFSRRKRPEDVVRALALTRTKEAHLLFLGEGPTRSRVERIADAIGVTGRVHMPGKVDDIRPFVSGAVALVQASSREGLPRSIMEALSLEVPCIVTTARGQEELVGADRGFVVPIGAISEMAFAMDRLASDPTQRRAMGVHGRQLMAERYELSLIIDEHERLYDELLQA